MEIKAKLSFVGMVVGIVSFLAVIVGVAAAIALKTWWPYAMIAVGALILSRIGEKSQFPARPADTITSPL